MMMSQYLKIATCIFLMGALTACEHEDEPFAGPSLIDRYGDFTVIQELSVNTTLVDFAAGETVIFTAEFNISVDWVIEITGTETGAVKRITGFDKFINAENATWIGNTTDLPFFSTEMCTVELLVPEQEDFVNTADVEIVSTRVYPGSLFTDFEAEPGSAIQFGNFEFELTNQTGRQNNAIAAQGDYFYFLQGTDNVVPNFFVGLINISSNITGETYAPLPTTIPENLYFNCFIRSSGTPHGIAVIQFVFDSNDSGAFEDGTDQTFQLPGDFPLNWTGWRHINHSMSEVGMTQAQLQKLVTIRVLLISDMNSQPSPPISVEFAIDYLTFTQGGPLQL